MFTVKFMKIMYAVELVILHDEENDKAQPIRSYQLNMSDFKFFTVIKHEGNVRALLLLHLHLHLLQKFIFIVFIYRTIHT